MFANKTYQMNSQPFPVKQTNKSSDNLKYLIEKNNSNMIENNFSLLNNNISTDSNSINYRKNKNIKRNQSSKFNKINTINENESFKELYQKYSDKTFNNNQISTTNRLYDCQNIVKSFIC